jgi:transposase
MHTMSFTCFGIGIDTARFGHHVSFLDQEKRTAAKPFHFKEDAQGYEKLRKAIESLREKSKDVVLYVRLDVAGRYADNLLHWLHGLDIPNLTISVGKPAANKAYREAHFDKRKADQVESLACARFAIVERPNATPRVPRSFEALRGAMAALESIATNKTRMVNQLHALLVVAFPELAVYVSDIASSYSLALLAKYPTAKRLANAKLDSIVSIPHMKEELAKTLHVAAKASTASSDCNVHQELVREKVKEILAVEAQQKRALEIAKSAWDSLPEGPHRRIATIKGIGIQTACALVAKIVSIDRFRSPKALIGYFGCFPEQTADSGTTPQGKAKCEINYHMSTKGNDLVRRLLYTASQVAVQHNPAIRALFARQMQLGKAYNVAIGHCMAKLLRQVYAVWVKDEDYDPDFESKQSTEENKKVVGPNGKAVEPQREEVTTTTPNVIGQASSGKRPPLNFGMFKSQLDIKDVLQTHRWKEVTQRGSQMRGPCPIHDSQLDERSFAVNVSKHTYCCHKCGSKGNALDLLVALTKEPVHDAAWRWIETKGLQAPTL